ncbi:aldo/keto reductase [Haloplanus aerogenes]|uniref:Alcohol dehydrogenase n=1 Tax=Haloplanus aerogenes TaxID=660522 RepID=A0A3M0D0W7_9EURY|nr:aldo/keto reductase [Haloplanus aerogenes]AZH24014.1 alcohol dehydrogenase [Haloplanus aerogenes]RMB13216.1 alcohol dehydrogenase (NADP+) [Haloplanus aerogenes]
MECAFVGCGAVARKYARGLDAAPLSVTAVCDRDAERAATLAADLDATTYADIDALLDAEDAPLILNLTSHEAHADVTERALRADRHVWSEKPLALDVDVARDLVALAERRGLALGCAPINHRCEAQRHARTALADGRLGTVRLAYTHAHVGRVTEWHDAPDSFLRVGPLYDGAVYPLSLLVAWFGPVERVRTADAATPWPDREARRPERPSHVETTLDFASGPLVRLTASFYAPHRSREFTSLECHGDDGSLYLDDAGDLGGEPGHRVAFGRQGRAYTPMPLQHPSRRTPYLAGPERLAASVRRGRPARDTARRAAHVVAVCNAVERAAERGMAVPVDGHGVRRPDRRLAVWGRGGTDEGDGRFVGPPDAALRLPPVGFGCSRYRDGEYVDRRDSIERALDAGYRFLDSAELYGNEARLGEILAAPGSPDRESLLLASKVWNTNHAHVAEACETTLADLGVDALDCYLLHWPDAWAYTGPLRRLAELPVEKQEALTFPEDADGERATADVSLAATWRRMEALYDRGLTASLGVCNVDRATLAALVDEARVPPAVVQVECHPYRPQRDLVSWCHERGIRVVAHSPLSAPGLLDDPAVRETADEMGVSPAAAVLAWHVERGVVPIPSSTDPDHVVENLAAASHRLPDEGRERLAALEDPEFER